MVSSPSYVNFAVSLEQHAPVIFTYINTVHTTSNDYFHEPVKLIFDLTFCSLHDILMCTVKYSLRYKYIFCQQVASLHLHMLIFSLHVVRTYTLVQSRESPYIVYTPRQYHVTLVVDVKSLRLLARSTASVSHIRLLTSLL